MPFTLWLGVFTKSSSLKYPSGWAFYFELSIRNQLKGRPTRDALHDIREMLKHFGRYEAFKRIKGNENQKVFDDLNQMGKIMGKIHNELYSSLPKTKAKAKAKPKPKLERTATPSPLARRKPAQTNS